VTSPIRNQDFLKERTPLKEFQNNLDVEDIKTSIDRIINEIESNGKVIKDLSLSNLNIQKEMSLQHNSKISLNSLLTTNESILDLIIELKKVLEKTDLKMHEFFKKDKYEDIFNQLMEKVESISIKPFELDSKNFEKLEKKIDNLLNLNLIKSPQHEKIPDKTQEFITKLQLRIDNLSSEFKSKSVQNDTLLLKLDDISKSL